eukprot:1273192-Rhodomonas_salina.2
MGRQPTRWIPGGDTAAPGVERTGQPTGWKPRIGHTADPEGGDTASGPGAVGCLARLWHTAAPAVPGPGRRKHIPQTQTLPNTNAGCPCQVRWDRTGWRILCGLRYKGI